MEKRRPIWWLYIRNVIREYPNLKKEYDALHQQSVTAGSSGMPVSGGENRGTENVALRTLPGLKQREYDAVRMAIEATKLMANGRQRLMVIEYFHWRKGHTLEGASMRSGYSVDRGKQIHGDFVRLVAKFYGFEVEEK